MWLLDEKRQDLGIAYAVGYPDDVKRTFRLAVGQGIVGTVVAEGRSLVIDDVLADPRYIGAMTDVRSQIAVPLRRKKRVIGALNLYGEHVGQFTPRDEAMLRQFGAHVAVAIENARLFEREKAYIETLETLAEIGREVAAILDLEQLLERVATLVHKVVWYRHVRHFPARRAPRAARTEAGDPLRRSQWVPAFETGRGPDRPRRCRQESHQRPRRHPRSPLPAVGRGLPVGSWRCRCW